MGRLSRQKKENPFQHLPEHRKNYLHVHYSVLILNTCKWFEDIEFTLQNSFIHPPH